MRAQGVKSFIRFVAVDVVDIQSMQLTVSIGNKWEANKCHSGDVFGKSKSAGIQESERCYYY